MDSLFWFAIKALWSLSKCEETFSLSSTSWRNSLSVTSSHFGTFSKWASSTVTSMLYESGKQLVSVRLNLLLLHRWWWLVLQRSQSWPLCAHWWILLLLVLMRKAFCITAACWTMSFAGTSPPAFARLLRVFRITQQRKQWWVLLPAQLWQVQDPFLI